MVVWLARCGINVQRDLAAVRRLSAPRPGRSVLLADPAQPLAAMLKRCAIGPAAVVTLDRAFHGRHQGWRTDEPARSSKNGSPRSPPFPYCATRRAGGRTERRAPCRSAGSRPWLDHRRMIVLPRIAEVLRQITLADQHDTDARHLARGSAAGCRSPSLPRT